MPPAHLWLYATRTDLRGPLSGEIALAEFDNAVWVWWAFMSLIGCLNIGLLWRMSRHMFHHGMVRHERLQLILCAVYVLGTASRCFVLRSDVARFAMFDSWLSTVLVGRSIATVAEVSFGAQWALLLWWMASRTHQPGAKILAYPLVPLLVTAQCCAWYGVLTTNYIGQTVEESLWTTAAGLFMVGMLLCRRTAREALKPMLTTGILCCLAYMAFMITVDVPNYYELWQAKEQAGATYLTFSEGLQDIQDMTLTGRLEDWRYPMVWQTLYFSVAVWVSLVMVWLPYRIVRQAPSGTP